MSDVFNTLGQNGTNNIIPSQILVNGNGTDLSEKEALMGRAKRKAITQIMMLKLIAIAEEDGETERKKSYEDTYDCQQNLVITDERLYGKYCRNRFCTLCCNIRKAEIMNKYYPVMKEWEEPYFLTLTVKSCNAHNLPRYIKKFTQGFQRITGKYRKRHLRNRGQKLIGIRSLECNFNPVKKTYNPHFHIITKDKYTAEVLLEEWLKLWTPKYTNRKGQHLEKLRGLEMGLIEVIKYGSKIFTEPDLKKRAKETDSVQIYLRALDTILKAMKNKHIFDRFGFNLPPKINIETPKAKLLTDFKEVEFNLDSCDWIDSTTNEALTNYKMPSHLQAILENNINTISK